MHDDLPHDHALARPELGPFVAAARAQTIAGTCVTSESVQAGLEHSRRRSHAQRMLWLSVPVAIAASLVAMVVLSPLWSRDRSDAERASANLHLATDVRMSSTGAAEVRDAWTVVLGEGTHEIELVRESDESGRPLHIELPGRTLELVEGRATIGSSATTRRCACIRVSLRGSAPMVGERRSKSSSSSSRTATWQTKAPPRSRARLIGCSQPANESRRSRRCAASSRPTRARARPARPYSISRGCSTTPVAIARPAARTSCTSSAGRTARSRRRCRPSSRTSTRQSAAASSPSEITGPRRSRSRGRPVPLRHRSTRAPVRR
jgi:hypothetical protein